MRLLFISHSSDCNGGGEKCLISLMKGLKSIHPDWELYLIIPSDGNKTILDACGKCLSGHKVMSLRWWLRSKKTSAWKKFFFSYRIFRKVTSLLLFMKKIRPDLCVTNTIVIPYLAMACRISHTPHCWFIHEIPWLTWKLNFVFDDKRIFRIIDKSSQKIIVPSKFTGQFYADKGITANKIASIAQSVEISPITDRQRRHSCYTILLIGSFAANKGQLELLKAVDGRIDNFAGIKYTFESLYEYNQCRLYGNGKYDMLHGQDETILPSLAQGGAQGGIGGTTNYNGRELVGIIEAWERGDLETAREKQNFSQAVINVICNYRGNIVGGKRIMKLIGLDLGENRVPFRNMTDEEEASMIRELREIGFFERCNKF